MGEADQITATPELLGPTQIRSLAVELGIRPTKTLGQNFLHDANTVRRIVRVAELAAGDIVLEVGPGLGSLTLGLLPVCARVVAVEVDPVLAGALPTTVAQYQSKFADRLTVLTRDALRLHDMPDPAPTALVANLPYNVAVPVLLHLLATVSSLRQGLVMVQAEVADRLVAQPGSKIYGVPSLKLAWYAEAHGAGAVPRSVFWPVPNVDSRLVAFRRRDPPQVDGHTPDRAEVFALLDAAFSQRRKMLRSALVPWAGSSERAITILEAAGIAPTARGEQLDIAAFARIVIAAGTHPQLGKFRA